MILVTGASGFIGQNLINYILLNTNESVLAVTRYLDNKNSSERVEWVSWDMLEQTTDRMFSTSYYLSEPAHKPDNEELQIELEIANEYREKFLRFLTKNSTRSLVYLSSSNVMGTSLSPSCNEDSQPQPVTRMAIYKLETEAKFQEFCESRSFSCVVLRSSLVYGQEPKGNLLILSKLVSKIRVVPFKANTNKRRLISVESLCELMIHIISRKNTGHEMFLVSDDIEYNTSDILNYYQRLSNQKVLYIPLPVALFKIFLKMLGKSKLYDSLFGNYQFDCSKLYRLSGWKPSHPTMQSFFSNSA
ncbi:NAD-dependent epimerase/dehydratase family protein [Pleionea litopenaei]|uniref:NAD-dependent epimerase/dehydratase family protein n=1 Tax=Pleionea litopenaei TaxID=3070815 RepID=A0AA51RTL8_9GAMM|nr:NAD-dependent epimerase/dehydratase family protein [Pleionea sp. HL-JVS1]WMS87290.1 NAD-dependent epimerase/dehydratase family protein [Pleionea sp. HL-JVS1]